MLPSNDPFTVPRPRSVIQTQVQAHEPQQIDFVGEPFKNYQYEDVIELKTRIVLGIQSFIVLISENIILSTISKGRKERRRSHRPSEAVSMQ